MKVTKNVRSTAENVPYVEVNSSKDTVYVRFDITRVEEIDFSGWNIGTEIQYKFSDYFETLTPNKDTESISLIAAMLMSEVDFLRSRIEVLEGGETK